jgi:uncharacterized protein YcfJ
MRRFLLITGLAAATLAAPVLAQARDACQQRNHDRKVTGTLLGAAGGALVGNAISHGGGGAVIGGVAGAAVGNNAARVNCSDEQTYFRSNSRAAARDRAYADNRRCHFETRRDHDSRGRAYEHDVRVCD